MKDFNIKLIIEIFLVILLVGFSPILPVFAMLDPGDGGGGSGLYITPQEVIVNPEVTPINKEITLSWFVPQQQYYCSFYTLVYQNRNEQGWQFLERIDGYGYKEIIHTLTEIGNYEFKVRIYAQYRYDDIRFYIGPFYLDTKQNSVVCARDFRELQGSANRYFPNIQESRLGYTINTTWSPWATPYLSFNIKEADYPNEDPNYRYFRLYIDGIKIFEEYYDIPSGDHYLKTLAVPELNTPGGHVIEIEINSGYIEYGRPHYILEYLKISKIEFNVAYVHDNKIFTPTVIYRYGEEKDYAFVAFDTRVFIDNADLIIAPPTSTSISFRPSIVVSIEPDWNVDPDPNRPLDYYANTFYIECIQFKWKVVDPNGNYIDSSDLLAEMIGSWYSADENDNIFGEILWILISSALFAAIGGAAGFWPEFILATLANTGLAVLDYLPNPPQTSDGRISAENAYYVRYENMYNWYLPPMEASMLSHSNFVFDNGFYGDYQVQITWAVKIYNHWVQGIDGYAYVFTLSQNYYINCQYLEHM